MNPTLPDDFRWILNELRCRVALNIKQVSDLLTHLIVHLEQVQVMDY